MKWLRGKKTRSHRLRFCNRCSACCSPIFFWLFNWRHRLLHFVRPSQMRLLLGDKFIFLWRYLQHPWCDAFNIVIATVYEIISRYRLLAENHSAFLSVFTAIKVSKLNNKCHAADYIRLFDLLFDHFRNCIWFFRRLLPRRSVSNIIFFHRLALPSTGRSSYT